MMNGEPKPIKIDLVYTLAVNYGVQQNRIPIIRKLYLENLSDENLHNLKIEIKGEPHFVNSWEGAVAVLPKNQIIEVEVNGFKLIGKFLSELTEKLAGDLIVSVSMNDAILLTESYNVDILAYDQWNGVGMLPEMLAAFVTPNHPEISNILQLASEILGKWTGNPSFDAYQSKNPDRVKKQMGAIFEAIANLDIIYCSPPASFENQGQRIRMCDTIFSQKLGTCVDMAILYASCMEAIGLNPLLIILEEHAFVGGWLIDDTFVNSVNDDISLLKKRIAYGINEIVLIESTCMNAGNIQSFDEAIISANNHLAKEEKFVLFIDVRRARHSGIKPLPQRIKTSDGWEIIDNEDKTVRNSSAPDAIKNNEELELSEAPQFSKQKLWERKLLDLSLRNNLLNLRLTQSTIQLMAVNLYEFEDALADGNEFQVLAKPEEWTNQDKASSIHQPINISNPAFNLLQFDLSQKRLRTYLTETELKLSLTKLYRTSRLSLEESGANTLYLALGFLKWFETPKSELPRYAPILLLPVEIIRKSSQKGYIIRSREEDPLMNITLLEMLKQDFGITINSFEELPRDESGVDVVKIFNTIRRTVMSQNRWDVEEHAFLGIFSFSKFIMWNDIHNNSDKLIENKVVKSLVSGKLEWTPDEIVAETNLDEKYYPSDIALPISADSTQLEAICAATQGESFVLHGPPGTGKSQTITNIIANALYQGKKVLFVAEKMAALNVVQNRLAKIGLDPFCLELHSNKSKKSTILDQLRKTTEVVRKTSPLEFATEAERLHNQRVELNGYVQALHKKHHFGLSLYDSFTGYAEIGEAKDNIVFGESFIKELSKEKIVEFSDHVEYLQNAGTLCGHPHNHPLSLIATKEYSPQKRDSAHELIKRYADVLDQKSKAITQLSTFLQIDKKDFDKKRMDELEMLCYQIKSLPDSPAALFNIDNPEQLYPKIVEISKHGEKRDAYRDELLSLFSKDILSIDAELNLSNWNVASQKWFLPKLMGQNKVLKPLEAIHKNGKIDRDRVVGYLETLINYQKEQEVIDENATMLSDKLDLLWNNGNCDWQVVAQISDISLHINRLIIALTEDIAKTKEIRTNLANSLSYGSKAFFDTKGKIIATFIDIVEEQKKNEQKLSELLDIDFEWEDSSLTNCTQFWINNAKGWQDNINSLRDWVSWNRTKYELIEANLSPMVKAYTDGELENHEVLTSFKKSLFKLLSEYIIANDERLSTFNGKLFEGKIDKFIEQSAYFEELTKAELFAKLASNMPSFIRETSVSSEVGVLQRAIRTNGRGISIRKLFDSIPNLLPKMCPCMLMSPISVAQYFEVDKSKFDLIIFDEASQMPTSEAIGAIARGQNIIVVGDPKQMPPTNFFSSNHFDEENADKEDLESILDDCLALPMPSRHLLWHYRSKHESLIAFSNSNYYENKLLTFPSPDDLDTKVTNVFVPGYYDRGKTRQNKFEAEAIIEEVIKRLSDPELSKRSLGIVTFSSAQQTIIEDLLNEAFGTYPELENIAIESFEPIFVKNLENVQGDERDVILFSMGYGPDEQGKVFLNFGPLNREGGWRRLNVAISRARYEMKVFSTLRSEQIDISRTTSEGVAGIKAFLEYTEKGKMVLPNRATLKEEKPKHFEQLIAAQIEKMGYSVETNIGCSGYKIDIGVVDPDKPSEYIMGILTDGKTYNDAKTAKDREIVQISVLKMLGWNIHKLWSTDWWDNPQKVIQGVADAIEKYKAQKKDQNSVKETVGEGVSSKKVLAGYSNYVITQKEIKESNRSDNSVNYQICALKYYSECSADQFLKLENQYKIMSQIKEVMEKEAPISQNLLSRRIINAWGISKLGIRVKNQLDSVYAQMNLKSTTQSDDAIFYWNFNQDPEKYNMFRTPRNEVEKRNIEDIPKEEINAAIIDVLTSQLSLPERDLIKEVAKAFGYPNMGAKIDKYINFGVKHVFDEGLIEIKNGRVDLSNNQE